MNSSSYTPNQLEPRVRRGFQMLYDLACLTNEIQQQTGVKFSDACAYTGGLLYGVNKVYEKFQDQHEHGVWGVEGGGDVQPDDGPTDAQPLSSDASQPIPPPPADSMVEDTGRESLVPTTTFESCAWCGAETEIDVNKISKCSACDKEILPCSACKFAEDGTCDWNEETRCKRFPRVTTTSTPGVGDVPTNPVTELRELRASLTSSPGLSLEDLLGWIDSITELVEELEP
jgi:hypothetical protein